MIIADKIIALRKKNGWSQEELAERLDVSRQSVSKWESGLSVPDLNKIIAMSSLFGVSTDYLLKDAIEEISLSETADRDDETTHTVSTEEANRYLDLVWYHARRIALGVMLCILSPIVLILLCSMAGGGLFAAGEATATAIGLAVLFALVAVAVALFVMAGLQLAEFEYLEKDTISLAYGVEGIVKKRRDSYAERYRLLLVCGILLCVVSAVPPLVAGALNASGVILAICVAVLLALASLGVLMIVQAGCVQGGFERLLQRGDYSVENKRRNRNTEAISTAYWCIVTAIYLGVSFLTDAWHITWVVWPVAGCLWPLIPALFGTRKP